MPSVPPSVSTRRFCRATRLAVGSLSLLIIAGISACGDTLYAPPAVAAAAPRLLLHACGLAFAHPAEGSPQRFDSPAPFR